MVKDMEKVFEDVRDGLMSRDAFLAWISSLEDAVWEDGYTEGRMDASIYGDE